MRVVKLPENFGDYNFAKLAKKEGDPRKRQRLQALHQLQLGKTVTEVARNFGVYFQAVSSWLSRFKENGLDGLKDKKRSGRKRRLSEKLEKEFYLDVMKLQKECVRGRVTAHDMQKLLKEKYKVSFSCNGIYTILKRLRIAWGTARSRHPKACPEAQAYFKKKYTKSYSSGSACTRNAKANYGMVFR